ncbi:ceramide synthase 1-like [Saccoglossus kowalevskii]|uniref:Ceramide synthase 1-like n=1 Tax=Saccoglossus kowalevskii TaxID=10224 RepID=A0ABM0MS12_SACKO|nr:PREDICTED: ceramide synthase 1-like [Saccoglossus kowalevskii]
MDDKILIASKMGDQDSVILPMPGYYEMLTSVIPMQWSVIWKTPTDFDYFEQFSKYCHFTWFDVFIVFLFAVLWTWLRTALTYYLFQPFLDSLKMTDATSAAKTPESMYKSIWYSISWSYTAYLLFNGKYTIFQDPASIFADWSNGMEVPLDIYIIYVYQCGFYVHSIYASIYVDVIRSDFYLVMAHHILTIMLLAFSYIVRYHKIGVLVLFCHDLCDVLLETGKIITRTKQRNGKVYNLNEYIANATFAVFIFVWILTRLYWYPLKVLYAGGRFFHPVMPFVTTFNVMLWMLLAMNLYWFWMILDLLARLLSGQMSDGIRDSREENGAVPGKDKKAKKVQ